jgi:hypothetical protein
MSGIPWSTPARELRDEELGAARSAIIEDIERFQALPTDLKEHSGSPGEWMYERLDELETEMKRRFIPVLVR